MPISWDNVSIKFSNTCKALSKVHSKPSIYTDVAVSIDAFFYCSCLSNLHTRNTSPWKPHFFTFNLFNNSTFFFFFGPNWNLDHPGRLFELIFFFLVWLLGNIYTVDHSFLLEKPSTFGFYIIVSWFSFCLDGPCPKLNLFSFLQNVLLSSYPYHIIA